MEDKILHLKNISEIKEEGLFSKLFDEDNIALITKISKVIIRIEN